MSATATAVKTNTINLRGSAQMVSEFFGYSINAILYQRGIYDPDSFTTVKKYGLKMYVSTDDGLTSYLKSVLKQMTDWLSKGSVKKLVLVITDTQTQDTMER